MRYNKGRRAILSIDSKAEKMMLAREEFDRQYAVIQNSMGWYDRSETGKIAVWGADRFDWLQGMVSNDITWLKNSRFYGEIRACLLDATGHILTDMILVPIDSKRGHTLAQAAGMPSTEFVLLDLPRENVVNVLAILDRYLIMEDVELRDVSEQIGCISVQGKMAYSFWDLGSPQEPVFQSVPESRSNPVDHTGWNGFDMYFAPCSPAVIEEYAAKTGVERIANEVIEVLRIEAGMPKYGAELDQTVIASEAVGSSHISMTKGCYVGQEIIARIDARGHTNRALTGMIVEGEILPSVGDKLFVQEGDKRRETGRLTSVVPYSPAADGKPIALGYVRQHTFISAMYS